MSLTVAGLDVSMNACITTTRVARSELVVSRHPRRYRCRDLTGSGRESSVHRRLRDDFYIGIVSSKGQKRRGLYEALIEETTFERVQQLLDAHRASGDRSHKHHHYLIGRTFICERCDRRLGYGRHRGDGEVYEYFSCLSRTRRGGRCGASYMQVEAVEQAMVDYHASITYLREQQERMRQAVRDFVTLRVDQAKKHAALHQRRLDDLEAEPRSSSSSHTKT
jgi:site-specific DNA recombinase